MLSLDQVRLLENRVQKAVGKITSLTDENARLRAQLTGLQTRVNELEGLVRSFKDDQGRIEEGILSALDRLSAFEDSVFHGESGSAPLTATDEEALSRETTIAEVTIANDVAANDATVDGEAGSMASSADDELPQTEQEDMASETATQLEIEAEWQNPPAKPSSDGQMDIF
jgi:hypothetical protein